MMHNVNFDETLPTPGMVRGAMAGALGVHAVPMGYGRRFANYTKQNGTDRLTARQRRRWHKKYFRAGRVITDDA